MKREAGLRIKRLIDIVATLAFAVLFAPVMFVVAVMVYVDIGRPVIFYNPRIGRNGQVFNALKFRSMRDLFDENGKPLPDDKRLTRFSKWLRATSLDELPQLWNVLKGEMSLIGPRPIITDYLPYLKGGESKRLEMRPGISGWAQVNGRNALEWDKRLEMDVWYVENWSLGLDFMISLRTLPVWLMAQGVCSPGLVTSLRLDHHRQNEAGMTDKAEPPPPSRILQDV
jgi:sugar transferase EpsL